MVKGRGAYKYRSTLLQSDGGASDPLLVLK